VIARRAVISTNKGNKYFFIFALWLKYINRLKWSRRNRFKKGASCSWILQRERRVFEGKDDLNMLPERKGTIFSSIWQVMA
jgi:hypothetical protein